MEYIDMKSADSLSIAVLIPSARSCHSTSLIGSARWINGKAAIFIKGVLSFHSKRYRQA
ncbi:hypothetical protein [Geotalea sp. SG265]|uniref:hypothetical protein n=1 Tax=Geotalea sp. SG265 TaxID=2922867 RepID=UPI001FAEAF66|nr:hypothetical protein [Geotalea sp. SG265]